MLASMRAAVAATVVLFATSAAADDDGDDFSNNLFSDLAPLLALFGERVTTQFMSQALGWADNIILAMGPLGIVTIVVSAIRVGGPVWLKAVIGRARENRAAAEGDLMSSTSNEVCELWNGQKVVRVAGEAPIAEFICLLPRTKRGIDSAAVNDRVILGHPATGFSTVPESNVSRRASNAASYKSSASNFASPTSKSAPPSRPAPASSVPSAPASLDEDPFEVISLKEAVDKKYLQDVSQDTRSLKTARHIAASLHSLWRRYFRKLPRDPENMVEGANSSDASPITKKLIIIRNKDNAAPNILLNIDRFSSPGELRAAAIIGTMLQIGVLLYSGFITYYRTLTPEFQKDGQPVVDYAYPCTAVGTSVLVSGLLICSHVVESSTYESKYRPSGLEARLIYLQKSGTVSDQSFGSFALFAKEVKSVLVTSRRDTLGPVLETKTVLGVVISLSGFAIQFIGLRSMHWSATVVQLGVTITMTMLRAFVRRDLANTPKTQALSPGFELDWLATKLAERFFSSPLDDNDDDHHHNKEKATTDSSGWLEGSGCSQTSNNGARSDPTHGGGARSWINKIVSTSEAPGPLRPRVSTAHTAMRLRKGLADLAPWPRPLSAEARAVATAIETTLDFLDSRSLRFESSMDSVSSEDPNRKAIFAWHIETLHMGKVYFRVYRQQSGRWKASEAEIEAALSLWNYGIQPEAKPARTEGGIEKNAPNTNSAPLPVLRLLGVNTARLRRDLRWWLPTEATKVMAVGRIGKPGEESDGIHHVRDCRGVIGGGPGDCPPGWTETLSYRAMELQQPFDTRCQFTHPGVYLATTSEKPPELLFAQHLFAAFMWTLARKLQEPIKGGAHVQASDQSQEYSSLSWQSITLQNVHLSRLAQDIHSTGIGDLEEVYLCLVPPLSSTHMLPQADSVVDWTHQHFVRPGLNRRWAEAIDAFTWLLGTFSNDDPVAADAVPATVSLLLSLAHERKALEQQVGEQQAGQDMLKNLQTTLEAQLGTAEGANLSLAMYARHGPPWVKEVVDTIVLEVPGHMRRTCSYPVAMVRDDYEDHYAGQNDPGYSAFVHVRDINGRTELHHALMARSYFSKRPGDSREANAQDRLGWTPLHFAASQNMDQAVIVDLIQAGGEVDLRSHDGMTPLHCAAMMGSTDTMVELINVGADVNAVDGMRNTALHWVALTGRDEAIRHLLPITNPTIRNLNGRTVLHQAVLGSNLAALQRILENGHDPCVRDQRGCTALHYAALKGDGLAVSILVEKLREVGADLDPEDRYGTRPVDFAARGGFQEICIYLLWAGGDGIQPSERLQHMSSGYIHISYVYGNILHHAAAGNCVALVQALIVDGHMNLDGAVSHAAKSGSLAAIKVLVSHGATAGYEALHQAAEYGHRCCVEYLENRLGGGAGLITVTDFDKSTPLHVAAEAGHASIVEFLLKKGCPIDTRDNRGCTALHRAARYGKVAAARMLLEGGCPVDLEDNFGRTALHEAAYSGDVATARSLLEWDPQGARVNALTQAGNGPLAYAAFEGHLGVVKLLVQQGARVDSPNREDCTPFHAAAECLLRDSEGPMASRYTGMPAMERRVEVLRFLVESGAEPQGAISLRDVYSRLVVPEDIRLYPRWEEDRDGQRRMPVRLFLEALSLAGPW